MRKIKVWILKQYKRAIQPALESQTKLSEKENTRIFKLVDESN